MGTLASQVIGFQQTPPTPARKVEAAYDRYLTGGNKSQDHQEKWICPFPMRSLSLHPRMQCGADAGFHGPGVPLKSAWREAIARYEVQNGAFGLVMNVKTGEILAMATLGGYDPTMIIGPFSTLRPPHGWRNCALPICASRRGAKDILPRKKPIRRP